MSDCLSDSLRQSGIVEASEGVTGTLSIGIAKSTDEQIGGASKE